MLKELKNRSIYIFRVVDLVTEAVLVKRNYSTKTKAVSAVVNYCNINNISMNEDKIAGLKKSGTIYTDSECLSIQSETLL